MTYYGIIEIVVFIALLLLITKPLGGYITRVVQGEKTLLDPLLRPVERGFYRLAGVNSQQETDWKRYALQLIVFNVLGLLFVYLLQRLQAYLPLNPAHLANVAPGSAFNTATSFATNTNWQGYGGENTMSYLTQMAGLAVQNFLSAATGIAVAIALIRAFARRSMNTIGNFWVDLTRISLWLLLPICILVSIVLIWQGTPQNFNHYTTATTLSGMQQVLPQGPIASQEVIKSLGTNGGGFFNVNSAHPYENPTPFTNFIQVILIFAIGAALTNVFGRMVGQTKQGWTLLAAMLIMFTIGVFTMYHFEAQGNPILSQLGANQQASSTNIGGNMEGKEVRFGIAGSALYNTVSTAASDGGVNSVLDSYTPAGSAVAIINMALGELIIGGVGSGFYAIIMFALLAVFIAGLMVGRTPEYLGKKVEAREMKLVMLALLISPFLALFFTAIACVLPSALSSLSNQGPHGFSEILYAFTSAANNNGSAFTGLNANTPFYNLTTALAMFFGRFFMIIPVLAIAGALVKKKKVPVSSGTLATTGPLFMGLLIGSIVLIAGLNFFPALALGPIVEQFFMNAGTVF